MSDETVAVDGGELRRRRKLRQLTQPDLARKAGVDLRTVQRAERSERLQRDNLDCIATVVGCTSADLTLQAGLVAKPLSTNGPAPGSWWRRMRWQLVGVATAALAIVAAIAWTASISRSHASQPARGDSTWREAEIVVDESIDLAGVLERLGLPPDLPATRDGARRLVATFQLDRRSRSNPHLTIDPGDLSYFIEQNLSNAELAVRLAARRIVRDSVDRIGRVVPTKGDWSFFAEQIEARLRLRAAPK